jgi:hypothetical protein
MGIGREFEELRRAAVSPRDRGWNDPSLRAERVFPLVRLRSYELESRPGVAAYGLGRLRSPVVIMAEMPSPKNCAVPDAAGAAPRI